ncbi:MAG: alpha/beta hydrolase-fold protein [Gemmatimonadales bacterium]
MPSQLARVLLAVGLLSPVAAIAQTIPRNQTVIGQLDSLSSKVLGESRRLLIYTPPSYHDTVYAPQRYPVLYLLDGDAHFHSVTGLIQILGTGVNGTFVVPEMIVVAIPNTDRTRDLTPSHRALDPEGKPAPFLKTSGGMGKFFDFIETELIPKIESEFRTAPFRVFVGHSLGGITTINALYTRPQLFNAYLAIDPSLWWDDRLLLKQAKDIVSKPGLEGRALYVAQANTISPSDTTTKNTHFSSIVQFNSILETYNRSGLRYAYKYYEQDDHGSVPLIAEYDALRFIFDGYKLELSRSLEEPDYVREHFQQVSKIMGYRVNPPEGMLTLLGQVALMRDTTQAVRIFRMATELYPDRAGTHAALGEALLAKGEREAGIRALDRALALDPNNARAKAAREKVK